MNFSGEPLFEATAIIHTGIIDKAIDAAIFFHSKIYYCFTGSRVGQSQQQCW